MEEVLIVWTCNLLMEEVLIVWTCNLLMEEDVDSVNL